MGCCLSTKSPKTHNPDAISLQKSASSGRSPPPVEEETVKEVLSETPIVPKPPSSQLAQNINVTAAATIKPEVEPAEPKIEYEPTAVIKPTTEEIVSEVSEVSEMCSFTESFSTTTMTEKREDDGEVNQRVVERSPVKVPRKRASSGELTRGRDRGFISPAAARSVPSPEKRGQVSSRPAQGRTMPTQRRNVGPSNGLRRDVGEGSGRRSRSPVLRGEPGARRNVGYKSRSLTPSGRSGERSPVGTVESNVTTPEKPNGDDTPENGESLENPHVSLECFIFL